MHKLGNSGMIHYKMGKSFGVCGSMPFAFCSEKNNSIFGIIIPYLGDMYMPSAGSLVGAHHQINARMV